MELRRRAAVEPKIRVEMEPVIMSSVPDADDLASDRWLSDFVDGCMQHYKRSFLWNPTTRPRSRSSAGIWYWRGGVVFGQLL